MPAPLTLHFVRHGEVHNPQKILYGRLPDFHLSETGRGQASATGKYLAKKPLVAVYASPMERAQETANIITTAHQRLIEITTDERLNECLTPHQGTPLHVLEAIEFELYTDNQPPYEQARDLRRRTLDFITDMRRTHPNGEISAVTHGDIVVTMFIHAAVGGDANDIGRGKLEAWGLSERYPATAGILTLTYKTSDVDEIPSWQYVRPY